MYGKGISREGDVIDMGVKVDVIEKAGSWYSYNGEKIGQGRENSKNYLIENPEICKEIEDIVKEKTCYETHIELHPK